MLHVIQQSIKDVDIKSYASFHKGDEFFQKHLHDEQLTGPNLNELDVGR